MSTEMQVIQREAFFKRREIMFKLPWVFSGQIASMRESALRRELPMEVDLALETTSKEQCSSRNQPTLEEVKSNLRFMPAVSEESTIECVKN